MDKMKCLLVTKFYFKRGGSNSPFLRPVLSVPKRIKRVSMQKRAKCSIDQTNNRRIEENVKRF